MSLEKLLVAANAAYIGAVVIAAIATFAIYHLSSAVSARKDAELERFRVSAQVEISKANAASEQARADSETARDEAAAANERARMFESNIASANLRAAEAMKAAERERLVRTEIEESTAWRRIDQYEQTKLAHRLESFYGQTTSVWFHVGDHEAATFATEIALALRAANWKTHPPASMITMIEGGDGGYQRKIEIPRTEGIRVASTEDSASRSAASAFVREFIALGFDAKIAPTEPRVNPVVVITVEVRPYGPQGKAKLRKSAR